MEQSWQTGDWASVSGQILRLVGILVVLLRCRACWPAILYTQLMAIITQGSLAKMREKMFNGMQDLPIKYFDTHNHGDVMSYYTNDIDTLRQMISQSIPQLLISVRDRHHCAVHHAVLQCVADSGGGSGRALHGSWSSRRSAASSARFFIRQQQAIGRTEGFVEEMMNGQKVIKVFCHEEEARKDFDAVNDELFYNAEKANRYANMLMPILNNIGNVLYVMVALVGGVLLRDRAPNLSISGLAFSISIVVPFLNMTKQFAGSISQVSNQLNSVIMGLAGTPAYL